MPDARPTPQDAALAAGVLATEAAALERGGVPLDIGRAVIYGEVAEWLVKAAKPTRGGADA